MLGAIPENLPHIIKGCKKQRRKSQSMLYEIYAERLANAAARYVGQDNIGDIVHDTFIKIFINIKNFRGDQKSLYGWMLKILINVALENLRKNNRITFHSDIMKFESSATDNFEIMDQLEFQEIWDLLKLLKPEDRIIINLSIVDGLSHKEIGELLSITPSHSRTRLTRAKAHFLQLIQKKLNIVV